MIPDDVLDRLQWPALLEASLTVMAVLIAVSLVWQVLKRVWPGLLTFIEFTKAFLELPQFMSETRETLAIVKHEVLPNNGSSLRDEVTTQGLQMDKMEARFEKDHERFAEIEEHLTIRRNTRKTASAMTPGGFAPHLSQDNPRWADSFSPYTDVELGETNE